MSFAKVLALSALAVPLLAGCGTPFEGAGDGYHRSVDRLPTNDEDAAYWRRRLDDCNQVTDEGPRKDCKDKVRAEREHGMGAAGD